jgi:hypothetical protein
MVFQDLSTLDQEEITRLLSKAPNELSRSELQHLSARRDYLSPITLEGLQIYFEGLTAEPIQEAVTAPTPAQLLAEQLDVDLRIAKSLIAVGIEVKEQLLGKSLEELVAINGIGQATAEKLYNVVNPVVTV